MQVGWAVVWLALVVAQSFVVAGECRNLLQHVQLLIKTDMAMLPRRRSHRPAKLYQVRPQDKNLRGAIVNVWGRREKTNMGKLRDNASNNMVLSKVLMLQKAQEMWGREKTNVGTCTV